MSSSAFFGGPIPQLPLIETNASRGLRDITWKARHLGGPQGAYMKLNFGLINTLGLQEHATSVFPMLHWGLQIGPYLYELLTDEALNGHLMCRRVHQNQAGYWKSDFDDMIVGQTTLTDKEIDTIAKDVLDTMRVGDPAFSAKGSYDFAKNNCHGFALRLLKGVIVMDSGGTVWNTATEDRFKGWRIMDGCQHRRYLELVKSRASSPKGLLQNAREIISGDVRSKHFTR